MLTPGYGWTSQHWATSHKRKSLGSFGGNAPGNRMRRLGDIVIACVMLAITLPLMIIVALAIKSESLGPVLDKRTCIGRGARRCQMLKFRTSVHDPGQVTPACTQEITRVGQFLRYTRIEALPELINVLRGEMSIIGDARLPSFFD
jgi:lipopolysaccharide/colanic/teichoic acid biosynthesis glycosyltransferase